MIKTSDFALVHNHSCVHQRLDTGSIRFFTLLSAVNAALCNRKTGLNLRSRFLPSLERGPATRNLSTLCRY